MVVRELRVIQEKFGYIPSKELHALSKHLNVPVYHLHAVASFFPHFRLKPPAPVEIGVCADFPCALQGCAALQRRIEDVVRENPEGGVLVRPVSCLGQCDGAPAISINDHIFARRKTDAFIGLVRSAIAGQPLHGDDPEPTTARYLTDPYFEKPHYGAVRKALATPDGLKDVVEKLKAANLVGMGGAGFPTGKKWEFVRGAPGDEKYVVCNADESEVGTFKDREIMHRLPHLLVEGMALAGLATGARQGYIYIRHEYEPQREALEQEIVRAQKLGVLGDDVLGSKKTFHLEVFVSPGGYICGEESALLEAMEGRRGEPRNKPPFPVTHGLWNKPTVINNVETLSNVPAILVNGPDWFKAQGVNGGAGLKFVGVSGHVNRPGVYEVPMGTPAIDVLEKQAGGITGGRKLKAFSPSGASSGFLPAKLAHTPLDFKPMAQVGSMLGSAAIVAVAEGTCMLDLALGAVRFFRNESCGKCVPCRVGSAKLVEILQGIAQGRGAAEDLETIDRLADTMLMTSICGLGQVVANPITSVITHFKEEVDDHVLRHTCPSGVCFSSTGGGA
ncbi:MAG: NAD(P)H-dependent oxidoreductase subunit E [Planctomycetes bacterium]|nr:NAD(P)H-dependent oxidoreductase subunit E [Planctomycetota bacterium]MBI3846180.1 NAD(P)H-dependent oxidoreductase subunit E [Planctomycetota bacterium]